MEVQISMKNRTVTVVPPKNVKLGLFTLDFRSDEHITNFGEAAAVVAGELFRAGVRVVSGVSIHYVDLDSSQTTTNNIEIQVSVKRRTARGVLWDVGPNGVHQDFPLNEGLLPGEDDAYWKVAADLTAAMFQAGMATPGTTIKYVDLDEISTAQA